METVQNILSSFQNYLKGLDIPMAPEGLYGPVRYALSHGGKRMRPVLLILAYHLYRDDVENAFDAACGMEIFHNCTLLHDDVMDKAQLRRGMPTVHTKWNENTAILSGDSMSFLAYHYIFKVAPYVLNPVLDTADKAFLGVCEGQQLDMDFESRDDVTEQEYMEMIRLKTSVLPAASLKIGGILAGAPDADCNCLYDFGENLGLAFQLQDDFLDTYGDSEVFGKRIGGDILCNKKTYLYVLARSAGSPQQKKEFDFWSRYDGNDSELKIESVKRLYEETGVRERCLKRIGELFDASFSFLDRIDTDKSRLSLLKDYATGLMNRKL